MKKLISAASALAMAASMVGAAVPFTTGAADATKGFELKAFTNKAGEAVSTKISTDEINAGDVTIPIAVYVKEQTPDSKSIVAQWAITSKDGDASNANVKFASYPPKTKYFSSNQKMNLANGSSVDADVIVGFCGTLSAGKKGATYTDTSTDTSYNVADKQTSWGVDTSWGSAVWLKPATMATYQWTGATSDAFPLTVFEVTFKKGTPAGTYSIDFLEAVDKDGVPATYFEAGTPTVKYTVPNKNITLDGIDIVIGDAGASATTTQAPVTTKAPDNTTKAPDNTTKAPSVTTVATTKAPAATTAKPKDPYGTDVVNDKFIVKGNEYTVKPGEDIEVIFEVETGDSYVSAMRAELKDLPAGITSELTDPACYADPDSHSWTLMNGFSYQIKTLTTVGSHPAKLLDKDTSSEYNNDVMQLTFHIPDDIAPGEYEYDFDFFEVTEFGQKNEDHDISMFNAVTVPGKIIVEGGTPAASTTAPATTAKPADSTTKPVSSATTAATTKAPAATTAAPAPGTANYGDTNCDGKVNIADVVVLNKWLNDAKSYNITAQGKLNADCCDAKGGEGLDKNDSDAIIRKIVHLVELPCASADLK